MLAFIFPGQGSQTVGMARDLYEGSPGARALLDELAAALDFPLLELMFEGPAEELTRTEHAQPALLAHSVAVCHLLVEAGVRPDALAGHSLGEYTALVAAGCLAPTEAAKLVRLRGQYMAEAGRATGGTMAAVLGLEPEALAAAIEPAREVGVVCLANLNAPGQVVISGEEPAVQRASELASSAGAKRVLPLNVSGAFHSPLMAPAAEKLGLALNQVALTDAAIPVVSNVDAMPRTSSADIRAALLAQLTGAVRWHDCIVKLVEMGVTDFVEVGPGKVLTGMLRRAVPEARALNADTLESIGATVAALQS
ncbi:MAG: ACP S-malonyltransferase [Armatimonadetes bacterium]|nr:ACP S-malonyltransferase [Armatimonadota bacterium]